LQIELFEWDDEKAEINLKKHRISFDEAATVFEDAYVLIEVDTLHADDEFRAYATGLSLSSRVLLVVYAERRERIRLISARRATLEERKRYESQFK
jgi:uncharacterized DUF497 family protein